MFLIEVDSPARPDARLWSTVGFAPGSLEHRRRGRLGRGAHLVAARPDRRGRPTTTLYDEAAAAGPGAGGLLALPYFAGERTPLFDPDLRGAIARPDGRARSRAPLPRAHGGRRLRRAPQPRDDARGRRDHRRSAQQRRRGGRRAVAADRQRRHRRWRRTCARARPGPASAPRCSRRSAAGAATLRDARGRSRRCAWSPTRRRRVLYDELYGWFRELARATRPLAHALAVWQRDALVARCRPRQTRDGAKPGRRREKGVVMTEHSAQPRARRRAAARRRRRDRASSLAVIVDTVLVVLSRPARRARAARPAGSSPSSPCGTRSRERAPRAGSGSSSPSWRPSPSWSSRSPAATGFAALAARAAGAAGRRAPAGALRAGARRALAQADARRRASRCRPARHGVLIMNLKSGGGKAEKFHLEDECRARGIEPVVLQRGDDLLQLARDAIDRGADVVGMAGGDGSQALVASIAAERGVPMVVIPAGTRNHFALDIGLDRDDVVGALDAYGEARERTHRPRRREWAHLRQQRLARPLRGRSCSRPSTGTPSGRRR